MDSSEILEVQASDWTILEHVARIELEAFGHEGLPAPNLALVTHCGKIFALREEAEIKAEAIVIGCLGEPTALLFSLAVAGGFRGKGRGKKLMEHILAVLPQCGTETLRLTVSPDNKAALKLYQNTLGFQKTGYFENHFGPGQHRLVLEKRLF